MERVLEVQVLSVAPVVQGTCAIMADGECLEIDTCGGTGALVVGPGSTLASILVGNEEETYGPLVVELDKVLNEEGTGCMELVLESAKGRVVSLEIRLKILEECARCQYLAKKLQGGTQREQNVLDYTEELNRVLFELQQRGTQDEELRDALSNATPTIVIHEETRDAADRQNFKLKGLNAKIHRLTHEKTDCVVEINEAQQKIQQLELEMKHLHIQLESEDREIEGAYGPLKLPNFPVFSFNFGKEYENFKSNLEDNSKEIPSEPSKDFLEQELTQLKSLLSVMNEAASAGSLCSATDKELLITEHECETLKLHQELSTLQATLSESSTENQSLKTQLSTLSSEKQDLFTEFQATKESFSRQLYLFEERVSSSDLESQRLQRELTLAYTQLSTLSSEKELFTQCSSVTASQLKTVYETQLREEQNKNSQKFLKQGEIVNSLQEENKSLLTTASSLTEAVQQKDLELRTLQQQSETQYEKLQTEQESLKCTNDSLKCEILSLQSSLQSESAANADLTTRVHGLSSELLQYKADQDSLQLLIKNYVDHVPTYTSDEKDPVDSSLGEYLNSLPTKSEVPFIKESSGHYYFGTHKILMKLKNDRLIIRVGGGYMNINEFITTHSQVELDKLTPKKPLLRRSSTGQHSNVEGPSEGPVFKTAANPPSKNPNKLHNK